MKILRQLSTLCHDTAHRVALDCTRSTWSHYANGLNCNKCIEMFCYKHGKEFVSNEFVCRRCIVQFLEKYHGDDTLRLVTLTPEPMGLRTWYKLKNISLSIGLDIVVKRKKLWEYIFLKLFGMACKLPVALNTDVRSVAFRLFNLCYFISHFVFHSLQMLAYIRMEQILFFSTRKFRQQLDSKGEFVTFWSWHDAFHCCTHVRRITSLDLDRNVLKMAVHWALKKICRKFCIAQYIVYLLI